MAATRHLTILISILTLAGAADKEITSPPTTTSSLTTTPDSATPQNTPMKSTTLDNTKSSVITATATTIISTMTKDVTSAMHNESTTGPAPMTNAFSTLQADDSTNITTTQTVTDLKTTASETLNTTTYNLTTLNSAKTDITITTQGKISTTTALQANGKNDLSRNPGLVAVLCIFCIVLGLLVVVALTKVISSKRNKFERLEDVPMGKMNEESPFAQYSK
ncbi:spore coat protein SP65-like [Hypomesus transpacificus]|uniref:spore coat protein SP65-like n=1 Tax=Hypomesus transpacificus TaxID=137520 RepID=UPI001F07169C|nr:spore coat protein SP65-like [Hypomesus transpacificus]